MAETLKISRDKPSQKSLDYKFLRDEGVKYIQEVAGKIWTDYNAHDPGVTILEALCYAITDLGHRVSYPIKDLISQKKDGAGNKDLKNFFTAAKILPNAPLTKNDYRKLLIDIEIQVPVPGTETMEYVGVKNAWIEKSNKAEASFFLHRDKSLLAYMPAGDQQESDAMEVEILYDILLEFSHSRYYGDLNENTVEGELTIYEHPDDTNLEGVVIDIDIECPRWDEDIDWNDQDSIFENIDKKKIRLAFNNLPNNYYVKSYKIKESQELELELYERGETTENLVKGIDDLILKIENFIFDPDTGLLKKYREKINVIEQILKQVRERLHSNRNLCEDFYKISALKVEEIAVCAEVELELEANIEEVQAEIYYAISKFLSSTVYFYTIDEMLDLCNVTKSYKIIAIEQTDKIFTINKDVTEILEAGDTVTINNSTSNDGDYTVVSVVKNALNSKYSDVTVSEDIASETLKEGEELLITYEDEDKCLTIDTIFEGPLLQHGFIDDKELEAADRKKFIRVSDIIQIIMDIKGVTSVKEIQIANVPQDNENNLIRSKNVKWCLDLAFDKNYVPRLSIDRCKFRFHKQNIPFRANVEEVEDLLDELISLERKQKIQDPKLDLDVPRGTYREIEEYTSIQSEFPLIYGIGEEGIPNYANLSKEEKIVRSAQVKQLKGYLMIFDQLLANYLSQLAHIKDLFSMNAEKDEKGNFKIGRTYYNQNLFDTVPEVDALYVNKSGHQAELDLICENELLFGQRRNKFLDHLMARFAEQFTDYAMLVTRLSGLKAYNELIDDKLAFLNSYPDISANRGKAFNYKDFTQLWHIHNAPGLEKRVSFLMGIPFRHFDLLNFSNNFNIIETDGVYSFIIKDAADTNLLQNIQNYSSEHEVKSHIEILIINGLFKEAYTVKETETSTFYFEIVVNSEPAGISYRTDYPDETTAKDDIEKLIQVLENEFYNNPESNRKNLSCPFSNYFEIVQSGDDPKVYEFALYSKPFEFDESNKLITGTFNIQADLPDDIEKEIKEKLWEIITNGINKEQYIFSYETEEIIAEEEEEEETEADDDSSPLDEEEETEEGDEEETEEEPVGDYVFNVAKRSGGILTTSVEKNFNQKLVNYVDLLNNPLVRIFNSTSNDGYYPVSSSSALGPNVIFTSENTEIESETSDGKLAITESFDYDLDTDNNQIIVDGDITAKLGEDFIVCIIDTDNTQDFYTIKSFVFKDSKTEIEITQDLSSASASGRTIIIKTYPYSLDITNKTFSIEYSALITIDVGDVLLMWDQNSQMGQFTIKNLNIDGSRLKIKVKEKISEDKRGRISFIKTYQVISIKKQTVSEQVNTVFTIKGGEGDKAVKCFIDFLTEKFYFKEGMHVVEHSLLRPKNKKLYTDLNNNGSVFFTKKVEVILAESSSNMIHVQGDISQELDTNPNSDKASVIYFQTESEKYNLIIESVTYNTVENFTEIFTANSFDIDISGPGSGAIISYTKKTAIDDIEDSGRKLLMVDSDIAMILPEETVEIKNSTSGTNDGQYIVRSVDSSGIVLVTDELMPVIVKKDCTYQIENPYTCIASVVLPYWPQRFNNSDFRRLFDQTLRMEAPAHIFLRVCWINPIHMETLEKKFKKWLVENARNKASYEKISNALGEFILALDQIRNVYPVGTLYNPDEDETLQNTIILNNTMLGNA